MTPTPLIRTVTAALLCAPLLMQGCALMSMTRSPLREATPRSAPLSDRVRLTATGPVNMYVIFLVDHEDLFPSSFRIDTPDRTIYIDPVLVDDPVPADYIFITHPHDDHLSLPDIDALSGPQTLIICPAVVAERLGDRRHRVVAPGDAAELDGVRFETIPSYNTRPLFLGIVPHPRKDDHASYVLEVEGIRILHVGDSDRVPELDGLADIDVALVPIEGGDLTMSTEDAAALVNALSPRIAVPMHYPLKSGGVERFRALVDDRVELVRSGDLVPEPDPHAPSQR